MRYAVLGSVQMTESALRHIQETDLLRPVALLTLEPNEGQERHSDYADIRPYGDRWNIPVWVNPADGDIRYAIREVKIDALCVFGWSRLLPVHVIECVPCYGWHPSILPKHRGRHPIIWQILKEESRCGFTIFRLTKEADAGPIIVQGGLEYLNRLTAGEFYTRMTWRMQGMLPEFLAKMATGYSGIPQDETQATVNPKRNLGDEVLNLDEPFKTNWLKVCALGKPYMGARLPDGTVVWTERHLRIVKDWPAHELHEVDVNLGVNGPPIKPGFYAMRRGRKYRYFRVGDDEHDYWKEQEEAYAEERAEIRWEGL